MKSFDEFVEDEVFKFGEQGGKMRAALSVLTDMLIDLNSLEVFYQKPTSKAITPVSLSALRDKIGTVKGLLHDALNAER
jgi:hypothetical protein